MTNAQKKKKRRNKSFPCVHIKKVVENFSLDSFPRMNPTIFYFWIIFLFWVWKKSFWVLCFLCCEREEKEKRERERKENTFKTDFHVYQNGWKRGSKPIAIMVAKKSNFLPRKDPLFFFFFFSQNDKRDNGKRGGTVYFWTIKSNVQSFDY